MTQSIYIDGSNGTVGLLLSQLLEPSPYELISLPADLRKDENARKNAIEQADLVVLCLPQKAVPETLEWIAPDKKVIDCSNLFRCSPDWVYGLPELSEAQSNKIREASRVTNPGCFAAAYLLAIRPLITSEMIDRATSLTCFAINGYSAGGKRMINLYENSNTQATAHSLATTHRHLDEMHRYGGTHAAPNFYPSVSTHREGLFLTIPVGIDCERSELIGALKSCYSNSPVVCVNETCPNTMTYNYPQENTAQIYVGGNRGAYKLIVRLNNLYKGAAGNVLQCIDLMLP